MISPFLCNFPKSTYIESYIFGQVLVLNLGLSILPLIMRLTKKQVLRLEKQVDLIKQII
jgi:hypothetical protein